MLLVKLFKLGIAFIVVAAALTTTTLAQELEETSTVEQIRQTPENIEQDRAARLQQYREQATEKLSEIRQERIQGRCEAAQTRLQSILDEDKIKADTRIEAHTRITATIQQTVIAVDAAGASAALLQQVSDDLQFRSDQVMVALKTYITALEDITALDCTTDVEGFQAGLSLARQERANLRTLTVSFREYVKSDVKTALQQIKSELSTE